MISNLRYQLQTMQLENRLPEILEEAARAYVAILATRSSSSHLRWKRRSGIADDDVL
jgi:hypothetical protein